MTTTDEQQVLVIHPGEGDETASISFLGRRATLRRVGCEGSVDRAVELISAEDGRADAIALQDIATRLQWGAEWTWHETGSRLVKAATRTPVVDGSGVRGSLERWGVTLAERAQPGIVSRKRVLMVPALNHGSLAGALRRRGSVVRAVDPTLFFGLPPVPGIVGLTRSRRVIAAGLSSLRRAVLSRLLRAPGGDRARRARSLFRWAEVLAGDVTTIRSYAPDDLQGRTVVVESADETDLDDLRRRGVAAVITLMPGEDGEDPLGRFPAATVEALLAARRSDPAQPLSEDTYLDLISEISWTPAVRFLQPDRQGLNRFAFVIHPLSLAFIRRHPDFRWTRFFPDRVVERVSAWMPPRRVGRITGGRSPLTGTRIEGDLIALGATPREMMRRGPEFTYRRLTRAANMAEARGARLMGLGAFTSVVGDAGATVAHQSPIAITSGNSLTVAATLEVAKTAVVQMGAEDLTRGRAMIVGATGSIGAVCSRMLALAIRNVVLVSIEPERLIELKRQILSETPGSRVTISTTSKGLLADCDLIVTATSAFGQRIVDISQCKPGAVICDVARPPDISEAEAALRPDVLVIESGEVLIPGDIDFGLDIGLPPKVAYACLAETALLAMEGRFESFTLGRELRVERVKEIYKLFRKHGFQLAGLRSLGRYQTAEDFEEKRAVADRLRADPELLEQVKAEASRKLADIPLSSKGVVARSTKLPSRQSWLGDRLADFALRRGAG